MEDKIERGPLTMVGGGIWGGELHIKVYERGATVGYFEGNHSNMLTGRLWAEESFQEAWDNGQCSISFRKKWSVVASWPVPRRGQTVRRILSSFAWATTIWATEKAQWDTFILPLSYHDPGCGEGSQWDLFILPLSSPHQGNWEGRLWWSSGVD